MPSEPPNLRASPEGLLHGILLTVGWVVCQHLSIFVLFLRNRSRLAIYFHACMMSLTVLLTAIASA